MAMAMCGQAMRFWTTAPIMEDANEPAWRRGSPMLVNPLHEAVGSIAGFGRGRAAPSDRPSARRLLSVRGRMLTQPCQALVDVHGTTRRDGLCPGAVRPDEAVDRMIGRPSVVPGSLDEVPAHPG